MPNLGALPHLRELNMVNNQIEAIDNVDFTAVAGSLERLLLEGNHIEFYSKATMKGWIGNMKKMMKLEELNVRGNPFVEQYPSYKVQLFDSIKTL